MALHNIEFRYRLVSHQPKLNGYKSLPFAMSKKLRMGLGNKYLDIVSATVNLSTSST